MEKDATGSPRAEEPRYKPNLASRLPNPETGQDFGNRRSHVYHKPTCRAAAAMAGKNRVTFASEAEAEKAGYRKAKDCW
jgi:deoxyribonuclease-1